MFGPARWRAGLAPAKSLAVDLEYAPVGGPVGRLHVRSEQVVALQRAERGHVVAVLHGRGQADICPWRCHRLQRCLRPGQR